MGNDGADDNNDFTIFLESRRGGVKLPRALRSLVQDTLTETFELESQEEALALGPDMIIRSVEGAGDDRFSVCYTQEIVRRANPLRQIATNLATTHFWHAVYRTNKLVYPYATTPPPRQGGEPADAPAPETRLHVCASYPGDRGVNTSGGIEEWVAEDKHHFCEDED